MKINILTLIAVFLCLLVSNIGAQELPDKVLFKLKSLEKPTEDGIIEGEERSRIIWTVFSDRSQNVTYTEPGSNVQKNTLTFMEAFCVLEERDEYIWLIKPESVDENGIVYSDAEDYGWVKADNMLLWNNCLITSECKINKKAMILNTIDAFKERIEDVAFAKFYLDPQLQDPTELKSSVYKVYYIYKNSENSVLLGRKSNFSSLDSKESIVGWVRKSRVTPWSHRLAIEPNWENIATHERESAGTKLRFFDSEGMASHYAESGNFDNNNLLWEENPYYEERKIGEFPRFPVLSNSDDKIVKVGIIDKMTSKYGVINLDSAAHIANNISSWRNSTKNINVVFVIDGSTSMQPYFKPVAAAVKNSMNDLAANTNNIFRFAGVVYRDHGEGARLIESIRLNSDYKKVSKFLDNIIAKNIFDKDTPEAVNFGLKNGILGVGLNKEETNVIILIGDAGNHHRNDETQVSESEIIDLMDEYECHLLAFQVHQSSHPSYSEFNSQMKSIILDLADRKYNRIKNIDNSLSANLQAPEFLPPNNGVFELNETAMVASLVTCEVNRKMPPEQIGVQVENVISRTNNFINDLKDEVQLVVVEGEELNTSMTLGPAFFYALKKAGLSDDEIKFYCSRNSQMYYEGYGTTVLNGLKNPLAKYMLFMDKEELSDILKIFDELENATSYNDKRKKLKETWIEILRKHFGNSEDIDIENINIDELGPTVLCLPKSSKILNMPLSDFTDPKKFSDYDFNKYVRSISNKRNLLRDILRDKNYKFSFLSDDKIYYWIDIDLMP